MFTSGRFGYIPDPPEPPSDEWFEEHCPRCKWNHEWFDGEWHGECLQGGCTGFEERDCTNEYQEGFCEDCDRFAECLQTWREDEE